MKISNHAFVVAGGGSGLGAATAAMLVAAGGKVVVADVNDAGAEAAQKLGAHARFVEDRRHRRGLDPGGRGPLRVRVRRHPRAINCAGIAPGERVVGKNGPHSLASFERAIRINLVGTFNVIRLAAAQDDRAAAMESGERGVIINTSSVASFEGPDRAGGLRRVEGGRERHDAAHRARARQLRHPRRDDRARHLRHADAAGHERGIRTSLGQQIPFPPRLGGPTNTPPWPATSSRTRSSTAR
jgi:NAD(P)-dependent dehydrogenase (short-subunit alcohol dehydrogenase family)